MLNGSRPGRKTVSQMLLQEAVDGRREYESRTRGNHTEVGRSEGRSKDAAWDKERKSGIRERAAAEESEERDFQHGSKHTAAITPVFP